MTIGMIDEFIVNVMTVPFKSLQDESRDAAVVPNKGLVEEQMDQSNVGGGVY